MKIWVWINFHHKETFECESSTSFLLPSIFFSTQITVFNHLPTSQTLIPLSVGQITLAIIELKCYFSSRPKKFWSRVPDLAFPCFLLMCQVPLAEGGVNHAVHMVQSAATPISAPGQNPSLCSLGLCFKMIACASRVFYETLPV